MAAKKPKRSRAKKAGNVGLLLAKGKKPQKTSKSDAAAPPKPVATPTSVPPTSYSSGSMYPP